MTTSTARHPAAGARRFGRRAGPLVAVMAACGAISLPLAAPAVAQTTAKPPIVVKIGTRPTVGAILVTGATGQTLYRDTNDGPNHPTCTGSCASVWPPLVLAKGDTKARGGKGVKGLGTVKLADGDLQVTYMKEPLYTFVGDSGHSVHGNGDGPFEVVSVTS
jgi:predicted lipoprotein with Yx(FWY)xxD motif